MAEVKGARTCFTLSGSGELVPSTFTVRTSDNSGENVKKHTGTVVSMPGLSARVIETYGTPFTSVATPRQSARAPRPRRSRPARNRSPGRRTSGDDADPDEDDVAAEVKRLHERCEAALDRGDNETAIRLYAEASIMHFAYLWERA
jgi:hypothetical protein